jgi:hypothetical protein
MSGTPSEAEIRTIWRNTVDLLETVRANLDGSIAGNGNKLDTLLQSLEGEYTPSGVAGAASVFRAGCSSLISPGMVRSFLDPILYEYGKILSDSSTYGFGGGFASSDELFRALYDWFIDNSDTVQSRNITFDTSAAGTGSNTGNGAMSRLTTDENGYDLEACTVETKKFICVGDQNSGTDEHAEIFQCMGEQSSMDALLRSSFGSGLGSNVSIRSHHAGSGAGGSLLTNSSFSDYNSSNTPKFTSWTQDSGAANISQDTTNYYRSHPGASTDGSLKLSGDAKISQAVSAMRVRQLDANTPYFLRLMYNRQTGSGDGTLAIRLGSHSVTATMSAQTGWNELLLTIGQNSWYKNFNEDPLDVEIELSSWSSGYVLVDDVILAPFDFIDGTYWFLRGNSATHTPWLVDDFLSFTDTGGAPTTGKIQWWCWVAGLGYLPSTTGTPEFTDP